jgi:hypothetical protein
MISASKSTLSIKNLNILSPKVTKNLTNLPKKFCEFDLVTIFIKFPHNFSLDKNGILT